MESVRDFQKRRWTDDNYRAISTLILNHGNTSEGYDAERPPIAIFDCDETLIQGDIGDALMYHMIREIKVKPNNHFWKRIPNDMGREAIRSSYYSFLGRDHIHDTIAHKRFRSGMLSVHQRLVESGQRMDAADFALQTLRGHEVDTIERLMGSVVRHELQSIPHDVTIPSFSPFPQSTIPIGIRPHLEMKNLIDVLNAHGFQIWVVTCSPQRLVQILISTLGWNIPEKHVVGVELQVAGGIYTDFHIDPSTVLDGKLETFLERAGRSPVLVLGDSTGDLDLMENCEGVNVVVNTPESEMGQHAAEKGWLIQSELSTSEG